jgi:hypothetical protein
MKRLPLSRFSLPLIAILVLLPFSGCGGEPPTSAPVESAATDRLEFTRMIVHWGQYLKPGYLDFIAEAEPEIVQVGFYGADFWTLSHMPDKYKGLTGPTMPSHAGAVKSEDPAERIRLSGDYFENLNAEIRKRGARPVGHFDMAKYLLGTTDDPSNPTGGFFTFYNELWDENELGPKPVEDPRDLLAKTADGRPLFTADADAAPYGVYYGCMSNPHWRNVLKAWCKRGIERGVDGFQINYFYRASNCHCEYCVRGFKKHMSERYTPAELKDQFGVGDLASHDFGDIVSRYPIDDPTPLKLEMKRFNDINNKEAFDEVFIEYGRSIKPDLISSMWGHSSGDFGYPPRGSNDERVMLPSQMWGKGESYLWYCLGKAEPTLQLRYIRGSFDDKPFTVCHYENVKIRASMAELMANGGAPMAKYINFTDPAARAELVRYFQFIKNNDEVYRANRPYGEAMLLHPRSENHQGRLIAAMTGFQEVGRKLLDEHVLFDIVPDEVISPDRLASYGHVYRTSDRENIASESFNAYSRFEAPATVRVSASRPAQRDNEIDLHFVNYDREEGPEGYRGNGIADEKPIAVESVKVDFVLPEGSRAAKVEVLSPETPDPQEIEIEESDGRIRFTLPEFLVYGLARIHLESAGGG